MDNVLEILKILVGAVAVFLAYRYTAGRADAAAARQAELEAERSRLEADREKLWKTEADQIVKDNDRDKAEKFMSDSVRVPVVGEPVAAVPGAPVAEPPKP